MTRHRILLAVLLSVISHSAIAQLVVDATGPVRGRLRSPAAGEVGSIGRKLPVDITVSAYKNPVPSGAVDKTQVQFTIRNTGKAALVLPVSPNPGDLEPADPAQTYTLQVMTLSADAAGEPGRLMASEVSLYSSESVPGTSTTLAPGQSIRVIARATLPNNIGADSTPTERVVAHVTLSRQMILNRGGLVSEHTEQLGYAESQPTSITPAVGRQPR